MLTSDDSFAVYIHSSIRAGPQHATSINFDLFESRPSFSSGTPQSSLRRHETRTDEVDL